MLWDWSMLQKGVLSCEELMLQAGVDAVGRVGVVGRVDVAEQVDVAGKVEAGRVDVAGRVML